MLWLVFIVLFILIYSVIILQWLQRWVLFQPLPNHVWTPKIPYTEVNFDGIHGWHFNSYQGAKTVLFCHGNSGNISHRSYIIELCQHKGLNLFLFDYHGFGKSKGPPSQYGICIDGMKAYQYLTRHVRPDDIIIWGESLGGASATYIASQGSCSSLVLWSTFASLEDVIRDSKVSSIAKYMFLGVSRISNPINLSNKDRLKNVRCPVIVVHSPEDEVIPYSNALLLHSNVSHERKYLLTIKGLHASPILEPSQFITLFNFCGVNVDGYEECCHVLDKLQKMKDRHMAKNKEEYDKFFGTPRNPIIQSII